MKKRKKRKSPRLQKSRSEEEGKKALPSDHQHSFEEGKARRKKEGLIFLTSHRHRKNRGGGRGGGKGEERGK